VIIIIIIIILIMYYFYLYTTKLGVLYVLNPKRLVTCLFPPRPNQ